MPPGCERGGVGHRLRAGADEPHAVLEVDRAGGRQRGVLAERVAGRGERIGLVVLARGPLRHRAQKQRRLLRARSLGEAAERVEPEQLDSALEQRMVFEGLMHALGMAALSGEEQR